MQLRFLWVDVFAMTALTGNPLPLVFDADDLPDEQMRAVAREFNQSESTFLTRPTLAGADYRLRSFTPAGVEVLGAGHNAMGAWIGLADAGLLERGRDAFVQQIGPERLQVRISRSSDQPVEVVMEQSPPRFLSEVDDRGRVAAALGLQLDDLDPARPVEVVSTGVEHLLVPLKDAASIDAAVPDSPRLLNVLAAAEAEGCYVYTTEVHASLELDAYTRFFNPTVGIGEDPATGTAAGPLAAALVRDGRVRDPKRVVVEQGRRIGRPSTIVLGVDGDVVTIAGSGLVIAEGTLRL